MIELTSMEPADIVVTGPEASGTRALATCLQRLAAPHGRRVRHFSLPYAEWWWEAEAVAGEAVVVITRRPDCRNIAAWRSGCTETLAEAAREWPRAIATLATIRGALWLTYEAMVAGAEVQLANLCAQLGLPFDAALLDRGDEWWPWRDGNAKYLA